MKVLATILIIAAAAATRASGTVIVDGFKEPAYGGAIGSQTVETGFGDNLNELDAPYAIIDSGNLCILLGGNLEANFNKLEIFIDSKAGGQAVFDSAGNDNADRMNGLVFDAGFTANYHIIVRRGNDNGNDKFDLDFADLGAQTFNTYQDFLTGGGSSGAGVTGIGINASPIHVAYDGSNAAGVAGGSGVADSAASVQVKTGLEMCIDLDDLGYAGGLILVMAGINGSGHDFWSNQFLGHLQAPQGNLGGDEMGNFTGEGAIDMNHFEFNQFFTIVPEPASGALGLLSVMAVVFGSRQLQATRLK